MRHRSNLLHKTGVFSLSTSRNTKTGKKCYLVRAAIVSSKKSPTLIDRLHKHFDPYGNRAVTDSLLWKFQSRPEAEQLLSIAVLKGLDNER